MSKNLTATEKNDVELFSLGVSRNTRRINRYKGETPTPEMVKESLQNWIALSSQKKEYLGENFTEGNDIIDDEITTLGYIISNTHQILAKDNINSTTLIHLYYIFQPNPYIEITDLESIFIVTEHHLNNLNSNDSGGQSNNSKTSYTSLITGLSPELQEIALNLELIRYKIVTEEIYQKMNAEEQYFVDELSETHLPAAFDAYNDAGDKSVQGELKSTIETAYTALNDMYFKYTQGEKDEVAKNAKATIDSFLQSNSFDKDKEYIS